MPDRPLQSILDRQTARSDAKQHFQAQLDLLEDLVNYGTNLIVRAYMSSPQKTTDVVVCGVLLKQIVAMLDAIQELTAAGIVHAAFLQLRAALEASFYIDWILRGDSDRKARCYVVASFRHERKWAKRAIAGAGGDQTLDAISAELKVDILKRNPGMLEVAERHIQEVDRILRQAELTEIDLEFERLKKGRRHDVEWHVVAGAQSLRQIARELQRLAQYEIGSSRKSVGNF